MKTRERLDVLLVERQIVMSREKARALILAGEVVVNDHRIDKAGTKVAADAAIRLKHPLDPWVSRGAHKLIGALDAFQVSPAGLPAIDVGASTGGFTQVMLERGATLVHALDVGHNQLAYQLRSDPRVKVYEGVNFRHFDPSTLDPQPLFATVDVSFIGLELIFPTLARALPAGATAIVLVKPQFELGAEAVGKGGVVRDPALRALALQKAILAARRAGFEIHNSIESPLPGVEGNIELLIHLTRNATP